MNRKRVWLVSFLIVCFATSAALAQQKVPPPPRPLDQPVPAVDPIVNSLAHLLGSIGRVSWSVTARNTNTNELTGPSQGWTQMTRATINPHTCEMRVVWNTNNGESGGSFFLEEFDAVEVSNWEQVSNQSPGLQYTFTPTIYLVKFPRGNFATRDQEIANQIADAFRQLAQQCKASMPAAKTDSPPSWQETMNFVEDKLGQRGAVNYLMTTQNTVSGISDSPLQMFNQISHVTGDSQSCRMNFHVKEGVSAHPSEFDAYLNLRRVEKLAVLSMQDAHNDNNARAGNPAMVQVISPAIWVLQTTDTAGNRREIPFPDEDSADRVAKALTHAVELCGGGSKDPF